MIVEIDFFSELDDYNRLLAFHEDYIFSDFEGLGVNAHVIITKHWKSYKKWDVLKLFPEDHYKIIEDFWTENSGIEYGYVTN